ncbi:MAG: GGDEF domain-containing protein, partial [Dehalococcoidia bacterium]|nr:GGDEF domain-containing protein [Dehalococcoidia bacterium]
HGHPKGDELLKQIVKVIAGATRPSDKIYRYGGEEFAILLPDITTEEAMPIANRIRKAVEQEQFEGEKESQPGGNVTVSIGVAAFPSDANNKKELIEAADSALCKAKQSGRNKVHAFNCQR